jgi:beta-lactamase class A
MKIFWIIGIVLLMSACNSPQEKLIADIRGYLPKDNGIYAVAYLDISSGEKILIHEHETFHAASTMKTPVMIEVYKQAAEGKYA